MSVSYTMNVTVAKIITVSNLNFLLQLFLPTYMHMKLFNDDFHEIINYFFTINLTRGDILPDINTVCTKLA